MNNKIFLVFSIITIALMSSGCNQYFKAEKQGPQNDIYYGVFNARDSVQADVKLFKRNSTMVCDGVMFFDSTRKAIFDNNKRVPAKMSLGCNDGTVIEGNWLVRRNDFTKGRGQGIDQFNNIYDFDSVSRYEFRKNVKQKLDFVNDKTTDNYLKY